MWPALILAARRKDSVAGRTVMLTVSVSVRNGFNQSGAPSGSRAAIKEEMFFVAELMIIVSHKGRPNVRVKIRWLDGGRMYGTSPVQLVAIRIIKRGVRIDVIPLIDFPVVRLIWVVIRVMGKLIISWMRDGEIHINV